uniref:Uncharacterized protein n=1 Tax=Elaeophora elaphi TaxID=1147741 RepID=A0A0R3S464_9BILA
MKEKEMIQTTTGKSPILKGKYERGDKIKTIKVSWDSARLSDKPLVEASTAGLEDRNHLMSGNIDSASPSMRNDESSASMIAGQLIVYDLDEEPPIASRIKRNKGKVIFLTKLKLCLIHTQIIGAKKAEIHFSLIA